MKSWEHDKMMKEEGYREMQDIINQLNILLSETGRTEDILKAAQDKEYQETLFAEFNLI